MTIYTLPMLPGAVALSPGMQVFGTEESIIGDKAGALLEYGDAIEAAGFDTPPRVVFPQEMLDEVVRANNWGESIDSIYFSVFTNLPKTEIPASVETPIAQAASAIREKWGDVPIAVRSTAGRDARGTGVYTSHIVANEPRAIRWAFLDVLESFFTSSAREWRRLTNAPKKFAIMMEPMVGQEIAIDETRRMAPILSGMGYSSSYTGAGFLKKTYGIGGGSGQKLTRMLLADYDFDAGRLFQDGGILRGHPFCDVAYENDSDSRLITAQPSGIDHTSLHRLIQDVSYLPILSGLEMLQEATGKPMYIEWAVRRHEGRQQNFLTQIAPIEPETDIWEFGTVDSALLHMRDVRRGHDADIARSSSPRVHISSPRWRRSMRKAIRFS